MKTLTELAEASRSRLPSTWHNHCRFRYAQRAMGESAWLVAEAADDGELRSMDYATASPIIDAAPLSADDQQRLADLLVADDPDERDLRALLSQCVRSGPVAGIDLDVVKESAAFQDDPEAARDRALELAQRIDAAVDHYGLGRPAWCITSARGGLHGDLVAPEGIGHSDLLRVVGHIVARMAAELTVPVRSDVFGNGRDRAEVLATCPAVMLDDNPFRAAPDTRGRCWRLVGTMKPEGQPKAPIDLATGQPLAIEQYVPPVAMDLDKMRAAICEWEAIQRQEEAERAAQQREAEKRAAHARRELQRRGIADERDLSSAERIEIAREALANCEPSTSGANGHDAAIKAACLATGRYGLSAEEAVVALDEWNARCIPPWSDGELRHKARDAERHTENDPERGAGIRQWIIRNRANKDVRRPLAPAADPEVVNADSAERVACVDVWPDAIPMTTSEPPAELDLSVVLPSGLGWLAEYIAALSESYQVAPELPAALVLSAGSLAISGLLELQISPDWLERPPVWTLTLLKPSELKSPVVRRVVGPLREHVREEHESLRPEIARERQRRRLLEKERDALERAVPKGLNPDQERRCYEIAVELDQPEPALPQLLVDDITPEELAVQLKRNGERAGVISAEGDSLDVMMGRYSRSPNLGIYLAGYSGDPYRVNRRERQVCLDAPELVFGLAVQPEAGRAMLTDRQSRGRGVPARFLYFLPQSRLGSRNLNPVPVPPNLCAKWSAALRSLLRMERTPQRTPVVLDDEASAVFHQLRATIEPALGGVDGELADSEGWGGKLAGNIARIALSLHALQYAACEIPRAVDAHTMEAACSWMPHLVEHYHQLCGAVRQTQEHKAAARLIDWLRHRKLTRFRYRDIQALRSGDFTTKDEWERVFKLLESHHWLRSDGKCWEVNPVVRAQANHTSHTLNVVG